MVSAAGRVYKSAMDLESEGGLQVAKVVWRHSRGGFACTVVCKATFDLEPAESSLAAVQERVTEADVYAGGLGGDVAIPSDLVPVKTRPEIIVLGHAHALKGQPAPSLVARLIVGEVDKAVQVVGDRYFDRDGRLNEPAPFVRMPLTWDRAAGGPDTANPAGRVLGTAAQPDFFGRVYAPNLLPRGLVLASRHDHVPPVGLGPIAPTWPSRTAKLLQHASGWVPGRWHERPLPPDIDLAYFNAAPVDQQRAAPFGEEKIYLEHLHPEITMLSTRLRAVSPTAAVELGAGTTPLTLRCDTLIIDADRGRAMLVWRTHVVLDRPDQPGRVIIRGPALPSARAVAPAPRASGSQPTPAEIEAAIARMANRDAPLTGGAAVTTWVPGSLVARPALPFAVGSPARAPEPDEGPPTQRRPDAEPSPRRTKRWRDVASETLSDETPPWLTRAAPLPFATAEAPAAHVVDPPAPFVPPAPVYIEPPAPAHVEPPAPFVPPPPFVAPAPVYVEPPAPFVPPAPVYVEPLVPLVPLAPVYIEPPAARTPAANTPSPPDEAPAPPPWLGAPWPRPEAAAEPGAEPAEDAEPPPIAFEAYPPERCGALAARLGCSGARSDEILRAEELDAGRWERVHEHWLEEIRAQAARSRKKLLVDYDSAYVGAIEAERGPLSVADYAMLAEAAERNAEGAVLGERGLPAGAWPHIHRVWIGRMARDARLGKEVRGAIEAARAAG